MGLSSDLLPDANQQKLCSKFWSPAVQRCLDFSHVTLVDVVAPDSKREAERELPQLMLDAKRKLPSGSVLQRKRRAANRGGDGGGIRR